MVLLIRLAALLAFWGLAVGLPGWLAGRRLVRDSPLEALLVGSGVVLLVAAGAAALTHGRMSRPVVALAGALVGIVSSIPRRR
ncbi:MAG: hypothetical protein RL199_2523 [Pseudomonadota bacterium]|jgi:uncharacterized membrane protein